jgi:hypothetical protein
MAKSKWYSEQPKNRNFLSPVGFKMNLDLFAGVDFFCQKANIPDITVPSIEVPTRFRNFPIIGGGGIQTGDLDITFIIDEELKNYMTVQNWIKKNGLYEEHSNSEPEYSNGTLEITSSNMNISAYVFYENLFPVSLTDVSFDVTDTELEYFTASVTFKYTSFELRNKANKKL